MHTKFDIHIFIIQDDMNSLLFYSKVKGPLYFLQSRVQLYWSRTNYRQIVHYREIFGLW